VRSNWICDEDPNDGEQGAFFAFGSVDRSRPSWTVLGANADESDASPYRVVTAWF
jgi:hypothetical protein